MTFLVPGILPLLLACVAQGAELHGPIEGLIWMAGKDEAGVEKKFDKTFKENEFLSGIVAHVRWNEIEPERGKYNHSHPTGIGDHTRPACPVWRLAKQLPSGKSASRRF